MFLEKGEKKGEFCIQKGKFIYVLNIRQEGKGNPKRLAEERNPVSSKARKGPRLNERKKLRRGSIAH